MALREKASPEYKYRLTAVFLLKVSGGLGRGFGSRFIFFCVFYRSTAMSNFRHAYDYCQSVH